MSEKLLTIDGKLIKVDDKLLSPPEGSVGAVDSVNGQIGLVELDGSNLLVGEGSEQTIAEAIANNATAIAGKQDSLGYNPGRVNPNLLDNWYFVNPVNQRGETSYSGNGYGFDRWKNASVLTTLAQISGGIRVSTGAGLASSFLACIQVLPYFRGNAEITISVLVSDISGTFAITAGDSNDTPNRVTRTGINSTGLWTATGTLGAITNSMMFGISKRSDGESYIDIAAVKLEIGGSQTLARLVGGEWVLNEIPDFGEELLKCQETLTPLSTGRGYAYAVTTNALYFTIPMPVKMRSTPAIIGTITLKSTATATQEGFTFSVLDPQYGQVRITATKSSHGLTGGYLSPSGSVFLSCEP